MSQTSLFSYSKLELFYKYITLNCCIHLEQLLYTFGGLLYTFEETVDLLCTFGAEY